MAITKFAAVIVSGALLLSSTSAFAGEQTRSASSVPALKALPAPVSGVRTTGTLRKKSEAVAGTSLLLLLAAGAAITAGAIVAANDSPG
ncbi:hypothetical protein GCM10009087_26470 [Sphingomonas oligophenolica]